MQVTSAVLSLGLLPCLLDKAGMMLLTLHSSQLNQFIRDCVATRDYWQFIMAAAGFGLQQPLLTWTLVAVQEVCCKNTSAAAATAA